MKKLWLCLFLLIPSFAHADTVTHGLTIPTTHPRLGGGYISTATTNCTSDVNSYRDRSAFLDNLINTGSTTFDDYMRWIGEAAILTFDRCYNTMSSGDRETYIATWNYYFNYALTSWMGIQNDPMNNYFWGTLRNSFEWAVATYEDNVTLAETLLNAFTTRWNAFLVNAADAGSQGGGYPGEGSQYGRYSPMWYSVIPQLTAKVMGRDLYSEASFFKRGVFFLIATTPMKVTTAHGWQIFSESDDELWMDGNAAKSSYWGDWMTAAAISFDGTGIEGYARQWLGMVSPSVGLINVPSGSSTAFTSLPLDFYASGPHYLWGRSTWDSASTMFQISLGGASGHGHDDPGSWQMWRDGAFVARESVGYSGSVVGYGGTGYVDVWSVFAHNGIVVNADAKGCVIGASCNNGGMAILANGGPVVSRVESNAAYSYSQTDLTNRYITYDTSRPYRGNPAVGLVNGSTGHVGREFVYVRALDTLVIFDRLQSIAVGAASAASITKTFLAHCETNPSLNDANNVTCTNGTQVMRITTLLPATPVSTTVTTEGGESSQYRIEINDSGSAQSYFLNVIQTRSTSDSNISPSLADNGGSYTVTLDATHSITFNKGMTSTGGSITISGGTTNFRSDVQTLNISDNGPYWDGSLYCGDGTCNNGETCATCSADCGACASGNVVSVLHGTWKGGTIK